jgi:DNA-binding transcriptional regulator YiaG
MAIMTSDEIRDESRTEMTTEQYNAALDKLGFNQQAAGRLFGVGKRTAGRWAQGQARIPAAVAMLLQLMVKKKLKLEVPVWKEEIRDFHRVQIWKFEAQREVEKLE